MSALAKSLVLDRPHEEQGAGPDTGQPGGAQGEPCLLPSLSPTCLPVSWLSPERRLWLIQEWTEAIGNHLG